MGHDVVDLFGGRVVLLAVGDAAEVVEGGEHLGHLLLGDAAVPVEVVEAEGELALLLEVAVAGEAEAEDEVVEGDVAEAVVVDDLEHVLAELVRLFLLALARVHLVMSKENIHYNLYVMLVLVYASFPFTFIYMF